ncbi:fungal-specific transcription factor domain-containing protein [Mycena rosella]|uniref:Fungal-specific transcription factor domain-containing protein n=1 Tax=Mycena rosella TaxID=1033263 RepID=A0AAD7G4C5_MYCRO|nr:fungal-specific transcription factor domain-containing protein [Mycena rosella]
MSSNDEDSYGSDSGTSKKTNTKRVQRACDMCRRKKRRCDGGDRCDHCAKHNFTCTYVEPSASRPTASAELHKPSSPTQYTRSYVEALEARLKTVEELLEKRKADKSPGVQLVSDAIMRLSSPFPAPHSDDLSFTDIDESFRALSINNTAAQGFQGKSSGAMLVKAAVDLRNRAKNSSAAPIPSRITSWDTPAAAPPPAYIFPDPDLLASLIELYFSNVNAFLPLLHRPTFEAGLIQQLHRTCDGFAKTVLLVCAVGARYSADPRVFVPGVTGADAVKGAETAGWPWFDQVRLTGHLVRTHPTLYDLQSYCLAAEFLDCTTSPRTCWTLVGFGMRLGQDVGAHRFKMRKSAEMTFEQELEKRASWVLFLFDAQISTALGRCIALQSHDFDIEMPLICDDEYWGVDNTGAGALFRQPADKPSRVAFFNCMLQLNRILSFSCKILYSTNRSKLLIGLGDDTWEEKVVVQLDSALNTWFESIPEHLRWDTENPIQDDTFFDQSAVLHCTYYHTRIIIHRPFIPAMRRAAHPTHLPSLAICNTAARACSHVAQIQQERRPHNPLWFSQTPLFTAGIVLLLNIWGGSGRGMGRIHAAEKDLVDVHRCMAVLSAQRQQWPSAGPLLDTLRQLVAVDHPLAPPGSSQITTAPQGFSPVVEYPSVGVPPAASFNTSRPAPFSAPPAAPFGAPSQSFGTPFPNIGLTPPMYDPALETAPPADYLADETWYAPAGAGPVFDNEQAYMAYAPPDPVFGAQSEFRPEDFGMDVMEMDTHTIALWERAPTGFGVADWDMYLGRFVDDVGVQQTSAQY